ncbi:MAG: DUF4491 family protein [Prevotellaceae bacterium]|nr:DUF4491 family protein [Prevotellaceae bacterium]
MYADAAMNYTGLLIGLATFLCIGIFHPLVIKAEYYFGRRCWWGFLLAGILLLAASLAMRNVYASIILGVLSCSCFWSILEIFEQHHRVRKGWFPMNPKRKGDYLQSEGSHTSSKRQ